MFMGLEISFKCPFTIRVKALQKTTLIASIYWLKIHVKGLRNIEMKLGDWEYPNFVKRPQNTSAKFMLRSRIIC